jgi:sarcosine oxidase
VSREAEVEVAVVGAGVMGLATARALARAGRDVVLCEQFAVGNDRGSSHGGSRIVRFSYPEERWVRLAQDSYPGWRALEAELGRPLLELHGTLDVGDWKPNRAALAACEVPFVVLEAADIERRCGVRVAVGERGLFQAEGGIIYADQALRALLESAQEAGAQLQEGRRIDAVEEEGDTVSLGALRARCAVVTAGSWAPELVGVDATPTRETTSYFALDGPVPSVLEAAPDGHRYSLLAPGVGLKAGLHQTGPVTDPDKPGIPDASIVERTTDWVRERFPSAGELIRSETCLYTTRPGDEFLLERRGRVVVGSPCSGHGFKFAPAIGTRLAALVADVL